MVICHIHPVSTGECSLETHLKYGDLFEALPVKTYEGLELFQFLIRWHFRKRIFNRFLTVFSGWKEAKIMLIIHILSST